MTFLLKYSTKDLKDYLEGNYEHGSMLEHEYLYDNAKHEYDWIRYKDFCDTPYCNYLIEAIEIELSSRAEESGL